MEKRVIIKKPYLYFPIVVGKGEKRLEIFLIEGEKKTKIMQFMTPVEDMPKNLYRADFHAEIPVESYLGKELLISIDAQTSYGRAILNEDKHHAMREHRPKIHFTADTGWTNDPNGLIYKDGIYHFYFQYNPFNVTWNNMSWGHAISHDLIHWEQQDSVLFPDESGTMFSGSAILNERGLLGLPKDAILYFYTAAGGLSEWDSAVDYTQKLAYSLDGGNTLIKVKEPVVPTIYKENRDPKVFWHEQSQGYIMTLWLRGHEYGILRSTDLLKWDLIQQITLEDAWECPDLFYLESEAGEGCWFFWSADGYYFPGNFDGYTFTPDGRKCYAYTTKVPYAAQTYSSVENRIITLPWIRMENDGRPFTGTYAIPSELFCKRTENGFVLLQRPVAELMENSICVTEEAVQDDGTVVRQTISGALVCEMHGKKEVEHYTWEINGTLVSYHADSGRLTVGMDKYQIDLGHTDFQIIIDDKILEMYFAHGQQVAIFILNASDVGFYMETAQAESLEIYEIH